MKIAKKMLLLSSVFALWTNANMALADLNSDAEIIFNWAESLFPQYFPQHSQTQTITGWRFRHYPGSGAFAGVNTDNQSVYVLGGPFGNAPLYIDTVAKLVTLAGGGGSAPATDAACDVSKAPAGLQYIQNGNNVKVTTNGACVATPEAAICVPPKATATGISVVSENNVSNFEIHGLNWVDPKLTEVFNPTIRDSINVKNCLINATQAFVEQKMEMDVCFDVTNAVNGVANSLKGLATLVPPVTMNIQSTVVNKTVADCFSAETNASVVTNAVTNEVWLKQNGQFVKIR